VSQAELLFNYTMAQESGSTTTKILEYTIEEGGYKALEGQPLWSSGENGLHFILAENSLPGLQLEIKRSGKWANLKQGDFFVQQDVAKSAVRYTIFNYFLAQYRQFIIFLDLRTFTDMVRNCLL
jgi:hypothetical protein